MGRFLNQSGDAFRSSVEDLIYVDESGLIKYTNLVLGKKSCFICNSLLVDSADKGEGLSEGARD